MTKLKAIPTAISNLFPPTEGSLIRYELRSGHILQLRRSKTHGYCYALLTRRGGAVSTEYQEFGFKTKEEVDTDWSTRHMITSK